MSSQKAIDKYSKQIADILAKKYTDSPKWLSVAAKVIKDLEKQWQKGDLNALAVLQKTIRREFDTTNYHKQHLQEMALQAMASNPELSIEPLLAMVRDEEGNLAFPKDRLTFLYYPNPILLILKDMAMSGFATKRLVYEFIRIGRRLDEAFPIPNDSSCGLYLFNIKNLVYKGDNEALLAGIPELNEDERKFLVVHGWNITA
jgi:hypothetical protein